MGFSDMCVAIVVVLVIAFATLIIGYWCDAGEEVPILSWMLSTIGFGLSFVLLLFEKGII